METPRAPWGTSESEHTTISGSYIKGVIFDFDGLIVDTNALWTEAEHACFTAVGVYVTPDQQQLTESMTTRQVASHWYKYQPWRGRSVEKLELDVIEYVRRELASGARTMPGAIDVIRWCCAQGYRIGLATNAPREVCEPTLEQLGVHDQFDAIVTEADVRNGKPHPAVYRACVEKLNLRPHEAIAFEDSPTGALAAVRAGVTVIGVPSMRAYEPELNTLCHRVLPNMDSADSRFFKTFAKHGIAEH
ncbi:HAD family phosphatase [Congregibacter brevis]|uniref:HAD family phosphatase n=1 Tax=Congregibacter brevis TaxID=3081201 RepID=A0ABZ0IIM4_9GAMM|nr:HAD family phosphatase [Congregibacter sp. IMCC45268]